MQPKQSQGKYSSWTRGLGLAFALVSLLTVAQADDNVVRFAVIGDMGIGCDAKDGNQCKIADRMLEHLDQFDFVITMGDNIYPDGNPADFPAKFEMPYQNLLAAGVPFYACLGNHDTESNRWRYEDANVNYPYYNMFDEQDGVNRRYYSFRRGAADHNGDTAPIVEFFALDSNRFVYPSAPADPDQLPWLAQRLQQSNAIWKIPYFHHPMYVSNPDGTESILRDKFEQLFIDNGVKLALSGHKHQFEEIRLQNDIRYIVSGAAGRLNRTGVRRNSPLLEKFNDNEPHFLIMEATPTALSWYLVDGNGEQICYTQGNPNPIDCRGGIEQP